MSNKSKTVKIEDRILATFDTETDPFKYGRPVAPFCWGFKTAEIYKDHWDNDSKECINAFLAFLRELKRPHLIYAHNGGKFDYMFFIQHLMNPIKIINGRIVEAHYGIHMFRDSYSIFPDSLSTYKKDEFNYEHMERGVRGKHRREILHYLKKDCDYLFDIVSYFVGRFGYKLTIGSTAIGILREMHDFPRTTESHDTKFRPYYMGGRCEVFEGGIIEGKFKIIDVNSMYPDVMKNCVHPCGMRYVHDTEIDLYEEPIYFITFEGSNQGALPVRTKSGLDFNVASGTFNACSHEIKVALRAGLVKISKIIEILVPNETISFAGYVDRFTEEKISAKKSGKKLDELFAKRIMNSAYGKTGQNPENHGDYVIVHNGDDIPGEEWSLYERHHDFSIWTKPVKNKQYYDVAIAASITSAARAKLLSAKLAVKRPIYCDTDSLICENEGSLSLHDTDLGAWKVEAEVSMVAIAGKKLYATFSHTGESGMSLAFEKGANKGVRMHPSEIVRVCEGEQILCLNDAPTINFSGEQKFIARNIKSRII